MDQIDLNGEWEFKAVEAYVPAPDAAHKVRDWMPATVPGTAHTDLMANGVIPDPFLGTNENLVQWVSSVQWLYRRTFSVPAGMLKHDAVVLTCNGLDTYAEIRINGKLLAKTSNMFVEHRLDAKRILRGGENVIEILFDAPAVRAKSIEKRDGPLRVALEPHRVYVRKAQYAFGWDWGPALTTSGIWRGIAVEAYSGARVAHPFFRTASLGKRSALVEVTADVERFTRARLAIRVSVSDGKSTVQRLLPLSGTKVRCRIKIPAPKLWWPNGHGDQPLYTGTVAILRNGEEVSAVSEQFAIRTVALVQERDAEGKSFIISINGVRIFCKGADWIPCDTFLPRIPDSTYASLLRLAAGAHMNMIRVWGGGIYERDVFYHTCDRLGLMVWQDFMFACGEYPQEPWFLQQVRDEAAKVVKRLRNHPSIVVWCGNNECEMLFCTENPGKHPDDMRGAPIFRSILPALCRKLDGTRIYWRSSPYGEGLPNGVTNGTRHQWEVWSGWKDYREYEHDTGRFVAEFGFQAPANRATLEEAIDPAERHPQSRAMEHHNKQKDGPARLFRYLSAHHRVEPGFNAFIYTTQLVQAEALKCAVEHWRRRKFRTAGSLIWQLNDCWPVSSWSLVDSRLRPKPAYFYARRFFAPLLLSFKQAATGWEVWLTSDVRVRVDGRVRVSLRAFDGSVPWQQQSPCAISPDDSLPLLVVPREALAGHDASHHYLHATFEEGGIVRAENRSLLNEPKHCLFPRPRFITQVMQVQEGEFSIRIGSSSFVKDLRLELPGTDAAFDENYFDLDPGVEKTVRCVAAVSLREVRRTLHIGSLT